MIYITGDTHGVNDFFKLLSTKLSKLTKEDYLIITGDCGVLFDFVSLDYSLGGEHTGLDILKWMKENGKKPKHINVHSNHIEGMRLMRKFAEENFTDSIVTMNTLYK